MSERPVILIADDNEDVVLLLRTYLRPLDCEILVATDGEEALTVAQARLPDLVLLDVMMPKRSGWEVCQTLKSLPRTAHIPVVLVTGRGDVKDRLTGLQVGADDYLVKPFDRNEVVKRIQALLNRKREQPAPAEEPERLEAPAPACTFCGRRAIGGITSHLSRRCRGLERVSMATLTDEQREQLQTAGFDLEAIDEDSLAGESADGRVSR